MFARCNLYSIISQFFKFLSCMFYCTLNLIFTTIYTIYPRSITNNRYVTTRKEFKGDERNSPFPSKKMLRFQCQRNNWRGLEFSDFTWIIWLKENLSTWSPLWSWSPFTPIILGRIQNLERWVNRMNLRETIGER